MLTSNLTGNFGNHCFHYSICRVVAEKLGFEWGINPTPSHDYFNGKNQMDFMEIDFGKPVSGIIYKYNDVHKHFPGCLINMYDDNVFNIQDNTLIELISQSEDYLIDRKLDVIEWFKIKSANKIVYEDILNNMNIKLDENLCVINFRGGEYKTVANLIARREYWRDSINYMLSINSSMKFIVITDDPNTAIMYIPNVECHHVDIGFDFYVVNQAKYVILSNSSFGWWAAWLNINSKLTIAPKYWAIHNTSNGAWSLGDQYTRCFNYMGRDSILYNYEQCKEEAISFYKKNGLL